MLSILIDPPSTVVSIKLNILQSRKNKEVKDCGSNIRSLDLSPTALKFKGQKDDIRR